MDVWTPLAYVAAGIAVGVAGAYLVAGARKVPAASASSPAPAAAAPAPVPARESSAPQPAPIDIEPFVD